MCVSQVVHNPYHYKSLNIFRLVVVVDFSTLVIFVMVAVAVAVTGLWCECEQDKKKQQQKQQHQQIVFQLRGEIHSIKCYPP